MLNLFFATGDACNLRCKYCYLPEFKKAGSKKADTAAVSAAREFVAKCCDEGIELGTVTLHGAEPGLLSPEAAATIANEFARAGHYQHRIGIQSNGTLFSDDYFERFESIADGELKFFVGVSIDGPAVITDSIRGHNVFMRATAGLLAANRRGYKTQILCVVSSLTLQALDQFGSWMGQQVESGQAIRLKPAYGQMQMTPAEQEHFAEWLHRTGYARFYQEIDSMMCAPRGNCCFWLEIDSRGGCYSCNKSYGTRDSFADWRSETLASVIEKRRTLYGTAYASPVCQSCAIAPICKSGCPMDRGTDGLALDCHLKRALLAKAASESGADWREVVDATSRFQFALRHAGVVPMHRIVAGRRLSNPGNS